MRSGKQRGPCSGGGGAGNRKRPTRSEVAGIKENVGEDTVTEAGPFSRSFSQADAEHDARHAAEVARAYLEAGAGGEPCAHLALEMAAAVMRRNDVALALRVLAGGEHVHARATALAWALSEGNTATAAKLGSGSEG